MCETLHQVCRVKIYETPPAWKLHCSKYCFLSFLPMCLHSARGRNDTKGFFFTPDLLWTSVHPSINSAVTTCPALKVTELLWLVPGHCSVTAGLHPGHTTIHAHTCVPTDNVCWDWCVGTVTVRTRKPCTARPSV